MAIGKHLVAFNLTATLLFLGCGASSTTGTEGRYELDLDRFAEEGAMALREAGMIPAGMEAMAEAQLRKITMDLTLEPGNTFTCSMSTPEESHTYTGNWYVSGNQIRIDQTHEDGVEKTDGMTGEIDGDQITLAHTEEGIEMRYVLRKQTAAAPQ